MARTIALVFLSPSHFCDAMRAKNRAISRATDAGNETAESLIRRSVAMHATRVHVKPKGTRSQAVTVRRQDK